MKSSQQVLPVIVGAQFACTSLWFAGNAVLSDLTALFSVDENALAHITSSVQLGFIAGTLVFAALSIADRFSPSRVFFFNALAGAAANFLIVIMGNSYESVLLFRFLTGFFLAGIYPVGMKIAADYFEKGLGKALGYLVGALVLGTALPHLLREFTFGFPWKSVLVGTSVFSILGGFSIMKFVPDGPYRKQNSIAKFRGMIDVFGSKNFRSVAFGYFGHMWELYTFWAFVPIIITTYQQYNQNWTMGVSLLSFSIIGIGFFSCIIGGYSAGIFGSKKVASASLWLSGACCLLLPVLIKAQLWLFLPFLFIWGMAVISDSPQFSALIAKTAPVENRGTALTIVNSIGFFITILSIQFLSLILTYTDSALAYSTLAIGPAFGIISLRRGKEEIE